MIKKSAVTFILMVGSLLTWHAGMAEIAPKNNEFEPQFLDMVYFGQENSEGDRVTVTNAPVIAGGLDVPARAVAADGGEITVEMGCDPHEETLVTLRLWGGNPSSTHLAVTVDGERIESQARVSEPPQEGRFYYVTIAIPTEYTSGQDSIELVLTAGNDSPDHAYAVYTHAENFYAPPADEVQGEPLESPEPSDPDFEALRENLLEGVDAAIEQQIQWQNDNPDSKQYGKVGTKGGERASANYLKSYKIEGSSYFQDEEILERALRHFDYHRRAQGRRGVLAEYGWRSGGWLGGPERSGRGGGLPGFMATRLGRGFMEAIPIFRERPELLDKKIDANGDGEANTTRREAYTDYWRNYLWENMLPRYTMAQKVYNQITVNGTSMMLANEILKFLSPEDAAPDDIILGQLRTKAGILPIDAAVIDFALELQVRNEDEYAKRYQDEGRMYENRHWHWSATRHFYPLSPKGIGIEFGYSPGYSFHMRNIYMDQVADDHRISGQIRRYWNGMQHVIYPTLEQTGDRWSHVGAIGERNQGWSWKHIGLLEGGKTPAPIYAALALDIEAAKRLIREELRYNDAWAEREWNFGNVHRTGAPIVLYEYLPALREFYENEEPTDYRLPAEREGPYAWCDEMVGLAMIHDSDGTLYLEQMNADARKRYHRITPTYRAFGDAKREFRHAAHVETISVGPYEVVMNRSNTRDVRVKGGPRPYVSADYADGVIDLISGKAINPSADQLIGPNESLVLDKRRTVDAPAKHPQPELVKTTFDKSTRTKHWQWSNPEGCAHSDVYSLPLDTSDATALVAAYYEYAISRGTRQHANSVPTFYRPDRFEEGVPISVNTGEGTMLAVETVDDVTNRLVVERPGKAVRTIKATGVLPTFEEYSDWSVENTGFPTSSVTTEDALSVEVSEETEITNKYPVTFTLPLEKPVKRILFLHESSFERSPLRTVLETEDGRTLWRGTHIDEIASPQPGGRWAGDTPHATDELVNLEGKHIEDAIHFRVRREVGDGSMNDIWYREMTDGALMEAPGESTTVADGWYRRISNVRIEYKDGTATYLHE